MTLIQNNPPEMPSYGKLGKLTLASYPDIVELLADIYTAVARTNASLGVLSPLGSNTDLRDSRASVLSEFCSFAGTKGEDARTDRDVLGCRTQLCQCRHHGDPFKCRGISNG